MALRFIDLSPDVSASIDGDYQRSSSRVYYAWFDPADDENTVRNSLTFGGTAIAIGSAHPTDAGQRCLGITVSCQGQEALPGGGPASVKWRVEVAYGLWNLLERSPDGNPVNIPTRFRLDFTGVETPLLIDVDGKPCCNSAGDYFDPPVTYDRLHCVLTVLRNEATVNVNTVAAWSNTTNLAVWNGFPVETVRLMPIKIPEIMYSQVTNSFYWPMQYEFEINFDGWIAQILNQGFRQLDDDGNLIPIFINGQPIDTPVMLDEDGKAILKPTWTDTGGDAPSGDSGGTTDDPAGGGEPPEGGTGTSGAVVLQAFRKYRTMDYTVLNMNTIFTLPGI